MIPTLSSLSVRITRVGRLRHQAFPSGSKNSTSASKSSPDFRNPPANQYLLPLVSLFQLFVAFCKFTAYRPYTPSQHSERLPLLFSRGCWHRIARDFERRSSLILSSSCEVYSVKAFRSSTDYCWVRVLSPLPKIPHCSSHGKDKNLVSVSLWPIIFSRRLSIVGLAGPLHHQLPKLNTLSVHQMAIYLFTSPN